MTALLYKQLLNKKNALNCTIYITESAENFAESNVRHPANVDF